MTWSWESFTPSLRSIQTKLDHNSNHIFRKVTNRWLKAFLINCSFFYRKIYSYSFYPAPLSSLLSPHPPPATLEFWDVVQAAQHRYWRGAGLPSRPPKTADRGQRGGDLEVHDAILVCMLDIREIVGSSFYFISFLLSAFLVFWNYV